MDTNFAELSDEEIIDFVVSNYTLFAGQIDPDFRKIALLSLGAGRTVIIKRPEGFAIIEIGRRFEEDWGHTAADLMFLHVAEEHTRQGIGGLLIKAAKKAAEPGVPIDVLCEGDDRKRLFERHEFSLIETWEGSDTFKLRFLPRATPRT